MTTSYETTTAPDFPAGDTVVLLRRPLRPGTPAGRLSRFADARWDLSPAVFEDHMPACSIGFDKCPPAFRHLARTYLWILLNTVQPVGRRRASGVTRLAILTISQVGTYLFPFFDFLAARHIDRLPAVTAGDYDAYLAEIKNAEIPLSAREDLVTEVRRLWDHRAQLPAGYALPDAPPWDGDATQALVGARPRQGENSTRRIPEQVMQPLLLWSIRYIEDFAPDILAAWREYLTLTRRNPRRRAGSASDQPRMAGQLAAEIPGYLAELAARGDGLPGKRDEHGTLRVDWSHLNRIFTCGQDNFRPGRASRLLIEASTLPIEDGAPLTSPITAAIDGSPWLPRRIQYREAEGHAWRLSTACLIVIAYLSGMRIGEVLSLRRGCVTHDQAAGMWLVYGTTWKDARDEDGNKVAEGQRRSEPWVVIPVVGQAITVLEQLHDSPLLFPAVLDQGLFPTTARAGTGRLPDLIKLDLNKFTAHINEYCEVRRRNDSIPGEPGGLRLTGSRFRRTLAWHIYRRPRGLVAGAIQYGHVRTQMFLGYAGNYHSGFPDDAAMEEFLTRLEELSDDVARQDAGEHVSGPAAGRYLDRIRDGHSRFAGRVHITAASARAMLANPSLQIFPGHGMTCVFDARKALCETQASYDARRTPTLDDCRSNCGNIARTDTDIAVLQDDISRLTRLVSDPLSPPIRHRREAARLRELQHIVSQHSRTRPPGEHADA